ncbi:MAG: putative signal transducing protein [Bacillota bacterium]
MNDNIDLVVLRTIENEFEMNMITAILEDNGIPYIVKNKGSGSYMRILTGSSPFNTDILVDSKSLEKAIELISPIIGDEME